MLNSKEKGSLIINGFLSGFMLCISCAVSMSVNNKPLGAFLFSLGLFSIIKFGFALYTGKAGYMAVKPPSYIIEVVITLMANALGAIGGSGLLRLTRFGASLAATAAQTFGAKVGDTPISIFSLSVLCGVLMFTAVDGYHRISEQKDSTGSVFIVCMPIMVFILCGFNHCIADMCYFFISGMAYADHAALYFLLAITGNAAGCMLIPFLKKFTLNP